jgi:predicted transcriptional regulator
MCFGTKMHKPSQPALLKLTLNIVSAHVSNNSVSTSDIKNLQMLKRHLKTSYNLSPDKYRQRWSLASNYPMIVPNYAKQ